MASEATFIRSASVVHPATHACIVGDGWHRTEIVNGSAPCTSSGVGGGASSIYNRPGRNALVHTEPRRRATAADFGTGGELRAPGERDALINAGTRAATHTHNVDSLLATQRRLEERVRHLHAFATYVHAL